MALHFVLKVNDFSIGTFTAVRRTGSSDPDSINTYDVSIDATDWEWDGTVEHRYGDEAWTLIRKALAQMESEVAAASGGTP